MDKQEETLRKPPYVPTGRCARAKENMEHYFINTTFCIMKRYLEVLYKIQ